MERDALEVGGQERGELGLFGIGADFVEEAEAGGSLTEEVGDRVSHNQVLFGAGGGDEEQAEAFVVGGAGVADAEQVTGERKEVVVALGAAPGEFVHRDHKDVFKLQTLGLVGGHHLNGVAALCVEVGMFNGGGGSAVIVDGGDEILESGGRLGAGLTGGEVVAGGAAQSVEILIEFNQGGFRSVVGIVGKEGGGEAI